MPVFMLAPTVGLLAVGLALTVFAGPLIGFSDRAAADLQDRAVYVDAVLGPGYYAEVEGVPR